MVKSQQRFGNTSNRQHGHRGPPKSPTYSSWSAMKYRTMCKTCKIYKYYGGVGIECCERWYSFKNFLEDMGPRPSTDHCLSRIDHSKDYTPGNVEWGLISENIADRNKRYARG